MSTIKNGQIYLYCHFNNINKAPGFCFQSPTFSLKHVRNVCYIVYQYLTKFHFDSTQDSKVKHKYNFHYVEMPMMMSRMLKSVDFTKTQKSRYLENKTLFFLQIKKIITHQGLKQVGGRGNLQPYSGWAFSGMLLNGNLSPISYNDETWHTHTLPKEDPKNI